MRKGTFVSFMALFTIVAFAMYGVSTPAMAALDDTVIFVIERDQNSGTHDYFNEHFLDENEVDPNAFADGYYAQKQKQSDLNGLVAETPNAIGYSGVAYVSNEVDHLVAGEDVEAVRPLKIDGKLPTSDNIKSGDYPVARSLYYVTDGEPAEGSLEKLWIDYIKSVDGQKLVADVGYVAYIADPAAAPTYDGGAATLKVGGSSTVFPVSDAAATVFDATYGVTIDIANVGSGAGITGLISGEYDVAAMSRAPKDSEIQAGADAGIEVTVHTVALDGISIIVHPDNPVTGLTQEQVTKIYNGNYTDWSDVYSGDDLTSAASSPGFEVVAVVFGIGIAAAIISRRRN